MCLTLVPISDPCKRMLFFSCNNVNRTVKRGINATLPRFYFDCRKTVLALFSYTVMLLIYYNRLNFVGKYINVWRFLSVKTRKYDFKMLKIVKNFAKDTLSLHWWTHISFLPVVHISDIGVCILTGVIWCCVCHNNDSYLIRSVCRQKVTGYTENVSQYLCNMRSSYRTQVLMHLYNIRL